MPDLTDAPDALDIAEAWLRHRHRTSQACITWGSVLDRCANLPPGTKGADVLEALVEAGRFVRRRWDYCDPYTGMTDDVTEAYNEAVAEGRPVFIHPHSGQPIPLHMAEVTYVLGD